MVSKHGLKGAASENSRKQWLQPILGNNALKHDLNKWSHNMISTTGFGFGSLRIWFWFASDSVSVRFAFDFDSLQIQSVRFRFGVGSLRIRFTSDSGPFRIRFRFASDLVWFASDSVGPLQIRQGLWYHQHFNALTSRLTKVKLAKCRPSRRSICRRLEDPWCRLRTICWSALVSEAVSVLWNVFTVMAKRTRVRGRSIILRDRCSRCDLLMAPAKVNSDGF